MLKKTAILTLLIVAISVNGLKAQSDKDIVVKFFNIFDTDPMEAMDYAFSTNKWMERNVDGVESLKTKYKNLMPLLGNYYGYEKITEKKITDRLKLVSFLMRYDRQPMRFTFVFYKPNDKWQVQNLHYDDDLDKEIEESANQNKN